MKAMSRRLDGGEQGAEAAACRRRERVIVFWDVDGTLLTTARAGVFSLEDALEQVAGVRADLQGMATAGMTDYAIAEAALVRAGLAADEATVRRFLDVHGRQLPGYLHRREGHVMPGVREILADLAADPGVASLLLTGNTEAGAAAKLAHYGLDGYFDGAGAFCVGPGERAEIARRALPLAAGAELVYVVGDTPADVECGKAIDARTVAVATGSYSTAELAGSEPWALLERLPDPAGFRALLQLDSA
jgi:phosphoglycolate phosphatase-like HAD superfamily hydrolase